MGTSRTMWEHACVANTYSTYKIVVSPHEHVSTLSSVRVYIDDVLTFEEPNVDKVL